MTEPAAKQLILRTLKIMWKDVLRTVGGTLIVVGVIAAFCLIAAGIKFLLGVDMFVAIILMIVVAVCGIGFLSWLGESVDKARRRPW